MASAPTPSEIHVLLVDDEGISRTTVARVLRNCAYRVTEVSDGLEAMHVLKESLHGREQDRFHLLLTDVMMPEVDGIALLRFVRAHEALRNLPVVMMSAHEQADTVFECIRGGAEDYLLKPIKKKEVQHIWQHVWRRKTQAQTVPSLHEDGNAENDARHLLMSVPQQTHQNANANGGSPNASERRTAADPTPSMVDRKENRKPARKDTLKEYLQRPGRQARALECLYVFQKLVIEVAERHKKGTILGAASIAAAKLQPNGAVRVPISEDHERNGDGIKGMEVYAAPETLVKGLATKESDIFVLGMVLFELFHPFEEEADRLPMLAAVKEGIFPRRFLELFPKIVELCAWMIRPEMQERPTVQDLMECEALREARTGLEEIMQDDQASLQGASDVQARLFLRSVWLQQQADACKVEEEVQSLEEDIATIKASLQASDEKSLSHVQKRQKKGDANIHEHPVPPSLNKVKDCFEELDHFWFDRRTPWEHEPISEPGKAEMFRDISMEMSKFVTHNRMECKATLKQADLLNNMEMICSMCFDRDDEFFAATGVCKKIKIYEYKSVVADGMEGHLPVADIACSSKLNSLAWSSYIKSHIASADCAGTVCLWDTCTLSPVIEFHEHTSRAWSVDLSPSDPTRLLSGSDDGSIRLWSMCQQRSVGKVDCNTNICSVQFCPSDSNLFAAGTTDHKAYLYDARNLSTPLAVLGGHKNSIAYVRFLGSNSLVTSSTDNTLKLWDLKSACADGGSAEAVQTYRGHMNEKNFVGLSVHPEGFIASGSEDNTVVAYHQNFTSPMVSYKFHGMNPLTGREELDDRGQFVSSLAFQRSGNVLLAANSSGIIKVLEFA